MKQKEIPSVGDVVYGVWGYDATFYEFYKVISFEGEWAKFQKLEKWLIVPDEKWPSYYGATPGSEAAGKPFRRKVKFGPYGWTAKGASNYEGIIGIYDGEPKMESAPGTY